MEEGEKETERIERVCWIHLCVWVSLFGWCLDAKLLRARAFMDGGYVAPWFGADIPRILRITSGTGDKPKKRMSERKIGIADDAAEMLGCIFVCASDASILRASPRLYLVISLFSLLRCPACPILLYMFIIQLSVRLVNYKSLR